MKLLNDLKLQFEKELWALKMLVAINKIGMGEGIEDDCSIRTDSTVTETNLHYPTNNFLIWGCMKTIDNLIKKLMETGVEIKVRTYKKQAKKTYTRSTTPNLQTRSFPSMKIIRTSL